MKGAINHRGILIQYFKLKHNVFVKKRAVLCLDHCVQLKQIRENKLYRYSKAPAPNIWNRSNFKCILKINLHYLAVLQAEKLQTIQIKL